MNLVLNLMVVITFFFLSKFGLKGNGIWNMEMLKFISILICKEHLLVKNLVRAKHVEIICNIKQKPLAEILNPGSGFLILILRSRSWVLDRESWFPCFASQIPGYRSSVLGLVSFIRYKKVCQKLLQSVTALRCVTRNCNL